MVRLDIIIFSIAAMSWWNKKLSEYKIESERQYVMLDVRFFLYRLACVFTGSEGMNFLPSAVHEMEERLSGEDWGYLIAP